MVYYVFGPATEAVIELILNFPGYLCNLLILLLEFEYSHFYQAFSKIFFKNHESESYVSKISKALRGEADRPGEAYRPRGV